MARSATKPADAKSLLFLSCDLVGSTQFKQSQAITPPKVSEGERYWQEVFLEFYRGFPQKVAAVAKAFESDGTAAETSVRADSFSLWKPIGDELVFTVEVGSEQDIAYAVRVWLETLTQYENDQLKDSPMKTKGGAFIATFPGPDSRATIPVSPTTDNSTADPVEQNDAALKLKMNRNRFTYDYFGPSIDTGFRIFSTCTHRYFSLSIEVVYALSHLHTAKVDNERGIYDCADIAFTGTTAFKGVWNGREYPVFAIDRHHNEPVNKALRSVSGVNSDPAQIKSLAHACLTDKHWPSRLYLPNGNNDLVRTVPISVFHDNQPTTVKGFETKVSEGAENQASIRENPPVA